ncbi:MAG: hypothetical protein FJ088_09000 [Deltaproteobacteria bacterium]|nr:hypothetical protein [Deltaproteobacteria bacterium]
MNPKPLTVHETGSTPIAKAGCTLFGVVFIRAPVRGAEIIGADISVIAGFYSIFCADLVFAIVRFVKNIAGAITLLALCGLCIVYAIALQTDVIICADIIIVAVQRSAGTFTGAVAFIINGIDIVIIA